MAIISGKLELDTWNLAGIQHATSATKDDED